MHGLTHRLELDAVAGRVASYVNMMMEDEGAERIKASYRGNFERLTQVKKRYDPANLFHLNQNIPPAAWRRCRERWTSLAEYSRRSPGRRFC